MFGHHDDKDVKTDDIDNQAAAPVANDAATTAPPVPDQPATDASAADEPVVVNPTPDTPAADEPVVDPVAVATAPVPAAEPAAEDEAWQHPGKPLEESKPAVPAAEPINDVVSPLGFPKAPTFRPGDNDDSPLPNVPGLTTNANSDDQDNPKHELIDIKQKALGELAPLIDDLDLSGEDKFRTIMMMIQASDDESLVAKAYAAAHAIEDEKVRAQALLDIVNEINYFTQPHEN